MIGQSLQTPDSGPMVVGRCSCGADKLEERFIGCCPSPTGLPLIGPFSHRSAPCSFSE